MTTKKAAVGQDGPPRKKQRANYTNVELARQMLDRFTGRDDVVAVLSGDAIGPDWLDAPLTPERFAAEHLGGQRCLALYLLGEDDKVAVTCLDFDNKPERPDPQIRSKVGNVVRCLRKLGLHPLVEVSHSGRGVHVWLFLQSRRSAWLVRAFWRGVLSHLKLPSSTEIYPRQDQRKGKGLGNPIRYPLAGKSHFVDGVDAWDRLDPMVAIKGIVPVKLKALKSAAEQLGFELVKSAQAVAVAAGNILPGSLSPRVVQLLADGNSHLAKRWRSDTTGMRDTSRSAIVAAIAWELVRRYMPTPEIEGAVKRWCEENAYEKGERQDWIDLVIGSAYEFVWKQDDCRRLQYRRQPAAGLPPSLRREHEQSVRKRVNQKTKWSNNHV